MHHWNDFGLEASDCCEKWFYNGEQQTWIFSVGSSECTSLVGVTIMLLLTNKDFPLGEVEEQPMFMQPVVF